MELRLQLTCLVPVRISRSRMHVLHILLIIQMVAQLIETGTLRNPDPYDSTNPYYPDLPILEKHRSFEKHFRGTTLFHFTLRSFIKCLHASKFRELGMLVYLPFETTSVYFSSLLIFRGQLSATFGKRTL